MAATDDELQKLGKPPIFSGKEDEWNEWSFVMRSYVSLRSSATGKCRGCDEPRHEYDENQSHPHR